MDSNHLINNDNIIIDTAKDDLVQLWDVAVNPRSDRENTTTAAVSQPPQQQQPGVLPTAQSLSKARSSLVTRLPTAGQGYAHTRSHIFHDIIPGLNQSSISPNYYGFVTGGVTPAALLADNVVSAYDQNVQVHLADHSVATDVDHAALGLLKELFALEKRDWPHSVVTSGATASNLLGLACGREFVLRKAVERRRREGSAETDCVGDAGITSSVGEYGLTAVLEAAGLRGLQVLSTLPHSSLSKAAGILGIGRANVKTIPASRASGSDDGDGAQMLSFDFSRLEAELARTDVACIVVVSSGEVNTGRFATGGIHEFKRIRALCDQYHAWLHVDAAFGIFTRLLKDGPEYDRLKKGGSGLEFADSIAGDAHKLLNVPYDCGFFFSRHGDVAESVFQNPNAAYLSAPAGSGGVGDASKMNVTHQPPIPSPLNIGIENSRRFRALPVYATLVAYGADGYQAMLERQIMLARLIARWLFEHPKYTVLPRVSSVEELLSNTFMIVLFKATDAERNLNLASKINATSKMFVSGTKWDGEPACRIAISSWKVQVESDFSLITGVLGQVAG